MKALLFIVLALAAYKGYWVAKLYIDWERFLPFHMDHQDLQLQCLVFLLSRLRHHATPNGYTILYYTVIHYTTLHYTTQHYTTLHCTTLHYTTPNGCMNWQFSTVQNCPPSPNIHGGISVSVYYLVSS